MAHLVLPKTSLAKAVGVNMTKSKASRRMVKRIEAPVEVHGFYQLSPAAPRLVTAASHDAQVEQRGEEDDDEVDAVDGAVFVDGPGVGEGGEGHEEKAQD